MVSVAQGSVSRSQSSFEAAWSEIHHGLGEYEDTRGDATDRARTLFFRAVWDLAPQAITDLHEKVGVVYERAWSVCFETQLVARYCDGAPMLYPLCASALYNSMSLYQLLADTVPSHEVIPDEFIDLWLELVHWAVRCGLNEYWCLDRALYVLWLRHQEAADAPSADDPNVWCTFWHPRAQRAEAQRQYYSYDDWDPFRETRAKAKRRIMSDFEHILEDRLEVQELSVREAGFHRTPRKQRDHFVWLVQYQVLRQGYKRVADSVYRDPKTVEAAIKQAAELVGIQLRPARRGRPKKDAA